VAAILMMVVHGFKMMSSADKADKVKAWLKWLLNVIIALVIIKVIDYVYYIAQLNDLVTKATDLIVEIARIVWFFIWALMVIMLLYAGFLAITDQWNTKNMEKTKNIIVWIIVSAVVIFALLLIIYEVFNEFA
jgi:magnesium-transporting ATPase (P-type)